MPGITERSAKQPLLNFARIGHGTLGVRSLAETRRFYEEVLGLDIIQTSPISMMVKKGTAHVYAVVEVGNKAGEMDPLNHNGLDVSSVEEVNAAYEKLLAIKDEYGLREIRQPGTMHGDYCFYFCDLDGNWWEIVKTRDGGHSLDFTEPERDMTGRGHELVKKRGVRVHMHDDEFRAAVNDSAPKASTPKDS
jgi:catechol 2,3-dioxygenase-like lactoylglutathione lyase family enzyme